MLPYIIVALGIAAAVYWMRRHQWGRHRILDQPGVWRDVRPDDLAGLTPDLSVREPRIAWKMVTFWSCFFLFPFVGHQLSREPYDLADVALETVMTVIGLALAAYAVATATRVVTADAHGLVHTTALGSQRVAWALIHEVRRRDVKKEVEKLETERSRKRKLGGIRKAVVHEIRDSQGNKLFSVDDDLVPADALAQILARARARS